MIGRDAPGPGDLIPREPFVVEDLTSSQPFGDGEAMVSYELHDEAVVITGASVGREGFLLVLQPEDVSVRVLERWRQGIAAEVKHDQEMDWLGDQ